MEFHNNDGGRIYILNMDDSPTKANEKQEHLIKTILPSRSNPKGIENAVFKYRGHLVKEGK